MNSHPNSSPDHREGVEQCDRQAMVDYGNASVIPLEAWLAARILAGEHDDDRLVQAFVRHRFAERERCAGIAENLIDGSAVGTMQGPMEAYRHACREIATAIRSADQ